MPYVVLKPTKPNNEGARGVMIILAGCGHADTSSNPGRNWLHFT